MRRKKSARSTFTARTREPVPFASFAHLEVKPEFAIIPHYNQLRAVTVDAYAPAGELASTVLNRSRPGLAAIKLPPGYSFEIAGEDKELKKGQGEMGGVIRHFAHAHRARHGLAVQFREQSSGRFADCPARV